MDPEEDFFDYATAITDNGELIPDGEAEVYAELGGADPIEITDMFGNPIALLRSTKYQYPRFKVPSGLTRVYAKSGDYWTPLTSEKGRQGRDGIGIADISTSAEGHLIITLTNGEQIDAGMVRGEPGSGVDTAGAPALSFLQAVSPGGPTQWAVGAREMQLQVTATAIQKKYVGDDNWTDMIQLVTLKGAKGDPGASVPGSPGAAVQMRVNAGWVQWKLVTEATWTNLYEIASGGGGGGASKFRELTSPTTWQSRGSATYPIWFDAGNADNPPWPSDIQPGDKIISKNPIAPPA